MNRVPVTRKYANTSDVFSELFAMYDSCTGPTDLAIKLGSTSRVDIGRIQSAYAAIGLLRQSLTPNQLSEIVPGHMTNAANAETDLTVAIETLKNIIESRRPAAFNSDTTERNFAILRTEFQKMYAWFNTYLR